MELMKNVQAWTEGVEVKWDAMQQIRNTLGQQGVDHPARMPACSTRFRAPTRTSMR